MVSGELGRYPISIDIKVRMIKSGVSLLWKNKVSFLTYVIDCFTTIIVLEMDKTNIQVIINKSGLAYIWLYQNCISEK
jgi:hypothetical protein